MLKTRLALVTAAVTAAAVAAPASSMAATTSTTSEVSGAVVDTLTVAAATPAALALTPGGTSSAVSAVVTITDTTPASPHSLQIADLASAYSGGVYPAGHTAGHMHNTSVVKSGPGSLANALTWSRDNSAWNALSATNAVVSSGGTDAVDPITVWFRQAVNASENLVALQTYGLTASYTVNG